MFKDFKKFAFQGNLIDMAVGIIIGGAFATVVKSLVDNVIMPPIGKLMKFDFSQLIINLSDDESIQTAAQAKEAGVPALGYGQFIQDFLSFLILAFVIFIVVKKVVKAKDDEPEEEPAPSDEAVLLGEIRDLLKK